jgi:hypothetical protein
MGRLVAGLALAACIAAVLVPQASADGDPASDVLYLQDVFVPYSGPSKSAADALRSAVAKANATGYRIKVAVIGSKLDLGTAAGLFDQPGQYVRFLGLEIQFFYQGHLLVVMPNGYGILFAKHSVALPKKLLAGLKAPGSKPDDLAKAAANAVSVLAAKDTSKPRYRDTFPPQGQPIPLYGRDGKAVKLEYTVYDDSLRASALVWVTGVGGKVILTHHRPLGPATGTIETLRWTPPSAYAHKQVQLCIMAKDAAGNVGKKTCTTLKLP